jgi:Transposase
VASDHTAVVLDETGAELARRRVRPVRASLEALRQAALAGAETGTVVEVVIEPTGPAWLPVAVFFAATGDVVYRVSSQKAADLRRYFRRHHKTNRIDATTWPASPSSKEGRCGRSSWPGGWPPSWTARCG